MLICEKEVERGQSLLDDAKAEAMVCYDCGKQLMHASRTEVSPNK